MAEYRLYCINSDNRIVHAAQFEADDDDEALELVRIRRETTDCELWSGKRKVASIPRGQPPIRASQSASNSSAPSDDRAVRG